MFDPWSVGSVSKYIETVLICPLGIMSLTLHGPPGCIIENPFPNLMANWCKKRFNNCKGLLWFEEWVMNFRSEDRRWTNYTVFTECAWCYAFVQITPGVKTRWALRPIDLKMLRLRAQIALENVGLFQYLMSWCIKDCRKNNSGP